MNARIGFEGPWKPAVSMGVLYAIAMWCATNGENVELFGAGTKGEGARCAGMAKKESCCEARVECCVDKGIGEGWVVVLPGGGLIFECDEFWDGK